MRPPRTQRGTRTGRGRSPSRAASAARLVPSTIPCRLRRTSPLTQPPALPQSSFRLPIFIAHQQHGRRVQLLIRGSKIPAERRRYAEHAEETGGNHSRAHTLGITLTEKRKDHIVVLGEFLKSTVPPAVVIDLRN